MSKIKKALSSICLALVLSLVVPVTMPQTAITAKAATVKINKTSATVNMGKTVQLKVTGTMDMKQRPLGLIQKIRYV